MRSNGSKLDCLVKILSHFICFMCLFHALKANSFLEFFQQSDSDFKHYVLMTNNRNW